jgi:radical S-adenosyl methionine domain-containing protein 2
MLSVEQSIDLLRQLKDFDVQKINFAGGEPTLCPYLGKLLDFSKSLGLITSIISNGTGITEDFLMRYSNSIDWIGLSIDSGNESTQLALGRGFGNHVSKIIEKVIMVKEFSIKLKINTVVTSLNFEEDMGWLLDLIKPNRWKVFQVLLIKNENKNRISDLLVSSQQFDVFVQRHKKYNPVVENNDLMLESYIMIDPAGRFFQNSQNVYYFSRPILEVGFETAFKEIRWNPSKFCQRDGFYDWS